MFIHIYGIARSRGIRVLNKETGEAKPYDKLMIYALEPISAKDWKLDDGSTGQRDGFGLMPIKDLSCAYEKFPLVFGVKESNELAQFVDKDCEVQFDRYGRIDQVKLRT